ncbi:unnamed protein product [Choristocarpus tenellus]
MQDFVRRLLEMGRLPLPALLRDPIRPKELDLRHKGLGDDIILAMTEVLARLPEIESLNVADNRLTDRSLEPLCQLIVDMPNLLRVDLSANKVDHAADTIRKYLTHRFCTLEELTLCQADVDDRECCQLMKAMELNRSLALLNLSGNKIGDAETLNIVQPDTITGGEAISEMMKENHTLKDLDLAWNNIRLKSALEMGIALRENNGLTALSVAHNSFSEDASKEIGDSLRHNVTLQTLNLSFNGVTPSATMVIASACKANQSLTSLNLDGNMLGQKGAAALLSAVRHRTGSDAEGCPFLIVSLSNCDTETEIAGLFNCTQPSGEYRLDASLPYSRMVVSELIEMAENKKGFEIGSVFSAKDDVSLDIPKQREEIRLVHEESLLCDRWKKKMESVIKGFVQEILGSIRAPRLQILKEKCAGGTVPESLHGEMGGRRTWGGTVNGEEDLRARQSYQAYDSLQTLLTHLLELTGMRPEVEFTQRLLENLDRESLCDEGMKYIFAALSQAAFRTHDRDFRGILEWKELFAVLQGLGYDISESHCQALVSVYDIDKCGIIEESEFVAWMTDELSQGPGCPKGQLLDLATGGVWEMPRHGMLLVSFKVALFPRDLRDIEHQGGLTCLIKNIEQVNNTTERLNMFDNAVFDTDITLTAVQAKELAAVIEHDQDFVTTAEKLLPQIVNPEQRARFIQLSLTQTQQQRLGLHMKSAFRALMGNPTGLYILDLSDSVERLAAIKLAEIANAERAHAKQAGSMDTSQKGNQLVRICLIRTVH